MEIGTANERPDYMMLGEFAHMLGCDIDSAAAELGVVNYLGSVMSIARDEAAAFLVKEMAAGVFDDPNAELTFANGRACFTAPDRDMHKRLAFRVIEFARRGYFPARVEYFDDGGIEVSFKAYPEVGE